MDSESAKDYFLKSAVRLHDLDETIISDDFLKSIEDGEVLIISSDLIHDFRIQTNSLDKKTLVFIPEDFSPEWGKGGQSNALWNLMIDTIIHLKHLSGPTMFRLNSLKLNVR